jgi:hypothetical protein
VAQLNPLPQQDAGQGENKTAASRAQALRPGYRFLYERELGGCGASAEATLGVVLATPRGGLSVL